MSTTALAAPIGATLALVVAYKVKFTSTLFSYHPTLLSLGWLAITPYAVHMVRESKKADKEAKIQKVQIHSVLNWISYAAAAGGLFAIYRNKELMAASKGQIAKHLVSPHGKSGAVATLLATLSLGIAVKNASTAKEPTLWKSKLHRVLGAMSYVVAGMSILGVVNGPWGKRSLGEGGQKAFSAAVVLCQALVAAPAVGLA